MAQDFSFDFNLPASPDSNIADPVLYKELLIVYNSMKLIAEGIDKKYARVVKFNSGMTVGTIVNFFDNAGETQARPAAYGVSEAHGFVSIAAGAGQFGEVKTLGWIEYNTSITVAGQKIWLSASAGSITGASPGAGSQRIGYFVSDRVMFFIPMLNA